MNTSEISRLYRQAYDLYVKGKKKESQQICEQILVLHPTHFDALLLSGLLAHQNEDYKKAEALLQNAILAQPKNAIAYNHLGNVYRKISQLDTALRHYNTAIELDPQYSQAYKNQGLTHQQMNQLDEALKSFDRAIYLDPKYGDAHANRGNVLSALNQSKEAIASFNLALSLNPADYATYYNQAILFYKLKDFQASLNSYNQLLKINPQFILGYLNRGNLLKELQRVDESVQDYESIISLDPNHRIAKQNKSLALLLGGRFSEGWKYYEYRWKRKSFTFHECTFAAELSQNPDGLKGKTILLQGEQGFGDNIQFCRYAKLLANLGANVILEVLPPLVSLLKNVEGVSAVIPIGEKLPVVDYGSPLLSTPLAFKTDLSNIPSEKQYVFAEPEKIAQWEKRLGPKTKPRIGISWSSVSGFKGDDTRSMTLSELIQLLDFNQYEYICLQKEIKESDLELFKKTPQIRFYGEDLTDFSETAALMTNLDLIISTCTSIPHLSAALGKPTWLLLAHTPDWRWLLDRDDTPWYPTMRLFRQEHSGNWSGVIQHVKSELRAYLQA